MTGKDKVKQLKKAGWTIDRIEGSHYVMAKDGRTVSIPVHANKDLKKGTENRINKDAGLTR
jgi:predicted RNA binding protein YcfA (HicA-like mRNA interferase family)